MSRRPTSKLSRRGFLAGVGLTGAAGLVPLAGTSAAQPDTGRAMNSVSPTATAVPHCSSIMSMQFQTYWDNRSAPGQASLGEAGRQQQAHLRWVNDIYATTFGANLRGPGRNLVTIKRRWDAQNYCHHPQSIPVE